MRFGRMNLDCGNRRINGPGSRWPPGPGAGPCPYWQDRHPGHAVPAGGHPVADDGGSQRAIGNAQQPADGMAGTLHAPWWLEGALVDGVYRTVAWVVSVMLPPMAIFFPLFTLLEDAGYLPRVAFNLDHFFQKAGAHGRQSLSMCMGLGCNACGVMGCRIIQSPRERLIAILTNAFIPCNGRLPTLTALIAMFFVTGSGLFSSLASAAMLMAAIVLAVAMTLWASRFLASTALKGEPSSFSLELPPYRAPGGHRRCWYALFWTGRSLFWPGPSP